ncbi:MAG: hypothetical protein KC417_14570, partial [Myxococcales bacterium]|nr:hypothetical protein [Myxococcales bacterium]
TLTHFLEDQSQGAPKLSVFPLRAWAVGKGAALRLRGAAAVAFVVQGDVEIEGVVDASANVADLGAGGPGGASSDDDDILDDVWVMSGRPGNRQSMTNTFCGSGGGGGSNGAAGGSSGACSVGFTPLGESSAVLGAHAGKSFAAYGEWTASLVGGGAGGPAFCSGAWHVDGGGGGGAVLISASGTVTIRSSGVIDAGGAGGTALGDPAGNDDCLGDTAAGGGGGAGGTVVLEARLLELRGSVWANGGGGGGGAGYVLSASDEGKDGTRSVEPAAGGSGSGNTIRPYQVPNQGTYMQASDGAAGGAGGPASHSGGMSESVERYSGDGFYRAGGYSGGGGGGVGRIIVRTADGKLPKDGTLSPSGAPAVLVQTVDFLDEP